MYLYYIIIKYTRDKLDKMILKQYGGDYVPVFRNCTTQLFN